MGMFEVTVEAQFTASHSLALPGGGREHSHSHRWNVSAVFRSNTLQPPMDVVVDFLEVQGILAHVGKSLEESHSLNNHPAFTGVEPSTERVAQHIAQEIQRISAAGSLLHCVKVTEAPGCSAAYYPATS